MQGLCIVDDATQRYELRNSCLDVESQDSCNMQGDLGMAPGGSLDLIVADITKPESLKPDLFQGVRAVICCTAVKVSPKEGDNANRDKYNQVCLILPAMSLLCHLRLHVGCQHLYRFLVSVVAALFISITDFCDRCIECLLKIRSVLSLHACPHHVPFSSCSLQSLSAPSYTML